MKVYITKYALTAGIEVAEVGEVDDDGYVYTKMGLGFQLFIMGKTAFLTYEEAAIAARLMRRRKVASLRKQADKVFRLPFPLKKPENLK